LARLHRGFRRNDPGYRCLVPGNGAGPIHADTLEWRDKFHKGVPDFQTDAKWWDAVVYHETKLASSAGGITTGAQGDVLTELGLGSVITSPSPVGDGTPAGAPDTTAGIHVTAGKPQLGHVPETEKDRADRLRATGKVMPSLSKDFGLSDL